MKHTMPLSERVKYFGIAAMILLVAILCFLAGCLLDFIVLPSLAGKLTMLFLSALAAISIGLASYLFLVRPFRKTEELLSMFHKGVVFEELFSLPYAFSKEFVWAMEKLHLLMDSKETLRMSVEQSRYLALQNQINPHFLYNTLDAIRADALLAGIDSVAKTAEALSTFFGYSISNLDKYATLAEELENVRNYMTIQQYRFGDSLQMQVVNEDEDKDVHRYYLPRMTLQPLVENAIYHGLEGKVDLGTVTIRMRTTQSGLFISVVDDGVGMQQEMVDKLNAAMHRAEAGYTGANQTRGGIAMKNVNSRIKLLFGEQYGLHIFSETGLGTEIRITLPIIQKEALLS